MVSVTPRDVLVDQPVTVTVSGLRPRSTVALRVKRSDYTSLVYERAGHLVGTAVPNLPLFNPSFGGTEAGDARGRADSWPKLLVFLARLKSS